MIEYRVFYIPLSPSKTVSIWMPQMELIEWEQMMAVLDAMKPGIVDAEAPVDGGEGGQDEQQ